mgnify:CR=1 FL=1
MTRDDALALDVTDPLAPLREQFHLPPGVIYLDGNSLGVLPRHTGARVQQVIEAEWGQGLIRSWNSAGWINLPQRVGDKIAQLVGVGEGELVVADSTSVNLFKVLSAALNISQADAPARRTIVSERSNFPTDLYIAQALVAERGFELLLQVFRATLKPSRIFLNAAGFAFQLHNPCAIGAIAEDLRLRRHLRLELTELAIVLAVNALRHRFQRDNRLASCHEFREAREGKIEQRRTRQKFFDGAATEKLFRLDHGEHATERAIKAQATNGQRSVFDGG